MPKTPEQKPPRKPSVILTYEPEKEEEDESPEVPVDRDNGESPER